MSIKLRTRKTKLGREPTLRDKLLHILAGSNEAFTVRELANMLGLAETTPFRPLRTLCSMNLIRTGESVDGTVYFINDSEYQKLQENAQKDPRRRAK